MRKRYNDEVNKLTEALFILGELHFRIDTYNYYQNEYLLNRVIDKLEEWSDHYYLIKDIKLKWWELGNKRTLVESVKLYKLSVADCLSKEQAKFYNLI